MGRIHFGCNSGEARTYIWARHCGGPTKFARFAWTSKNILRGEQRRTSSKGSYQGRPGRRTSSQNIPGAAERPTRQRRFSWVPSGTCTRLGSNARSNPIPRTTPSPRAQKTTPVIPIPQNESPGCFSPVPVRPAPRSIKYHHYEWRRR